MHYEYFGTIWLSEARMNKTAFSDVINDLLNEEDEKYHEYYNKYLENINSSSDILNISGSGDFDDMEAMESALMMICDKIISTYPECSMESHYCGTNMASSTEWAYNIEYKNHHVKKFVIEGNQDGIFCPECDEWVVSYGSISFNTEYECDECGRTLTEEEILEEISDWIEEYDV